MKFYINDNISVFVIILKNIKFIFTFAISGIGYDSKKYKKLFPELNEVCFITIPSYRNASNKRPGRLLNFSNF